jgi:hypothetical protein
MELGMGLVKGERLEFPWLYMRMPAGPGVYRFDCVQHLHDPQIPMDDRWEVDWQYVGEGGDCWRRLRQYEEASMRVVASSAPTYVGHDLKLASRLMWALREDDPTDEVGAFEYERRVLLSWVTTASLEIGGEPAELDMANPLERRFVERVLMMLSPWCVNKA